MKAYLEYVSPVLPLIGDYAFKCVVENSRGKGLPVTEDDIRESTRLCLREDEVEQLEEKQKQRLMSMVKRII